MRENLLEIENLNKTFPGVHALKDISFSVANNEIMGLIGENGAGKSTLMKVIGGLYPADNGMIKFGDEVLTKFDAEKVIELGIAFVHQELNLNEELTVYENIFMGRYPVNKYRIVDDKQMILKAQEIMKQLENDIDVTVKVKYLPTAKKQILEIARAISLDAKLIIFDEPTTSLTKSDVEILFKTMNKLKSEGVTMIYISHRLEELFQICDRVSVLRDGKFISCNDINDITEQSLIKDMVGRELDTLYPKVNVEKSDKGLVVENLCNKYEGIENISFKACRGEIVGFTGLVGSGRTDIMRLIFGADKKTSGNLYLDGKLLNINNTFDALKSKFALITEDRRNQGLLTSLDIENNINISSLYTMVANNKKLNDTANNYRKVLNIKANDNNVKVTNLSGGNQQKVIVARWLNTDAEVYIFDEPTKGIDVGAKTEVYNLINKLIENNKIVIVISSEMQEILGISHRIYVMCEKKITGELITSDTNQEEIMKLAMKKGTI